MSWRYHFHEGTHDVHPRAAPCGQESGSLGSPSRQEGRPEHMAAQETAEREGPSHCHAFAAAWHFGYHL